MLEIRNLYKAYGKLQVLDGLNLTIHEGELFGFVGSNGAGKTTTIKIITGLLQADSGEVLVDGVNAGQRREALKSQIGYVPDFFGVYDNLKVSEYMEFFASCYGIEGLRARQRYMALLEQVGLEEKVNFYVDGLSRGMKQRLCLARALIQDPQLLVLDEPASGLDPRSRLEMKGILKELRDQGKTIMLSSHILSELSEICTDIGIIDQGKMAAKGSIEDILSRVNASNPLLITVLGEVEKTMTLLRSHPYVQTISVKGKDISVGFSGEKRDEAMLLQRLVDAEIPVSGFMRERGSLESIFMQFIRQDAILQKDGIQQDETSKGGGTS